MKTSKTLLTPESHPLTCVSVAQMAELVDAPASGAGTRKGVEVRSPLLGTIPKFTDVC